MLIETLRALVIHHTGTADIGSMAEKIKNRLEDLGMEVVLSPAQEFKDFKYVAQYDVIAFGAPCLACRVCHGAVACRAAKKLSKKLKKLLAVDLTGKKLITFASSVDPASNDRICKRIGVLMSPTRIKLITSIGWGGEPPDSFVATLKTAIQEQMFK